ncbi:MAG TPA: DNA-binding protein [Rhodocyclaceae bacterium]|nr:DNA-binding protein [Rhodocyclaceae bacterium]
MASGITEQDVFRAADAILLDGLRPTVERVRQKIGRGSPNTVSPHLDVWFKGLGARIHDPQAFATSATTPDPVSQVAGQLWQIALTEARTALIDEFELRSRQLVVAQDQLETARRAFAEEQATLRAKGEAAATALTLASVQLEEGRAREVANRKLIDEQRARISQIARTAEHLQAQGDALRQLADQERRELITQLDQQARHWQLEIDRERQAAKQTWQRQIDLEKQLASLSEERAARLQAEERAAKLQADVAKLNLSLLEQEKTFAAMRERAGLLEGALDEARRHVSITQKRELRGMRVRRTVVMRG